MYLPKIQGVIDRRILANFRIRPEVIARILPRPFRPKLIHGWSIGGICLIRLKQLRPRGLPSFIGVGSENAAHRIAVEWDQEGQTREGVFVQRRDSSSLLNALAGGRLFPSVHHHAAFTVVETANYISIALISDDGKTRVRVEGRMNDSLPATSIFTSCREASDFFEAGALGYSPSAKSGRFDAMELRCRNWHVQPLAVEAIESSFFQDESTFPRGSIEFDCALVMRGIEHEWHNKESVCCDSC
jgi:hypothetical protein